jgi:2-phospho-L-lactate/phosphoenolpyruvate guanylyltransferase
LLRKRLKIVFINNELRTYVIVPHRGIQHGKSRLVGVLDDGARAQLNRWLLERTLEAIGDGLEHVSHCVVVSPCEEALELACGLGATVLREAASSGSATDALNAALAHATAHAAVLGAGRVLILPCDLPWLTANAISEMTLMSERDSDVVIAPDRHQTGTNALLVDAATREFAFGAQSFARHLELARSRGKRVHICQRAELEFDLDTPEDYAAWLREGGKSSVSRAANMLEVR